MNRQLPAVHIKVQWRVRYFGHVNREYEAISRGETWDTFFKKCPEMKLPNMQDTEGLRITTEHTTVLLSSQIWCDVDDRDSHITVTVQNREFVHYNEMIAHRLHRDSQIYEDVQSDFYSQRGCHFCNVDDFMDESREVVAQSYKHILDLEKENTALKEDKELVETQLEMAIDENARLRAQIQQMVDERKELEMEVDHLDEQIDTVCDEYANLNEDMEELENDYDDLHNDKRQLQQDYDDLDDTKRQLQHDYDELDEDMMDLQKDTDALIHQKEIAERDSALANKLLLKFMNEP